MKTLKCKKCGTRFKDREDPEDTSYLKQTCWNCRFVLNVIDLTIKSLGTNTSLSRPLNRIIRLNLDDVGITKI